MQIRLTPRQVEEIQATMRKMGEKYDVDFMVLAIHQHESFEMFHLADNKHPVWMACAQQVKNNMNRTADAISQSALGIVAEDAMKAKARHSNN